MQNSRDSSVFRGLARPLGDALAFGMGMTLAQTARKRTDRSPGESGAGGAIEAAIDHAVSARIESSFDGLRREIDAMQHDYAKTMGGLLAEHVAKEVSERSGTDLGRLRVEIAQTQREFADAVGQIVTQQIEAKVQTLAEEIDRQISEHAAAVRDEMVRVHDTFAERMAAILRDQVDSQVSARTSAIHKALSQQIDSAVTEAVREEAAGIRKETAGAHQTMANFLSAVGSACRDAAEKAAHTPPAQLAPASADEARPPEFSQLKKTGELLRIPLVSSLVLTVGGMLLAHYM
jgi:hypothetical protein